MLDNHLRKVIRYENRLDSLKVDDPLAAYIQDNPEEKEIRKNELVRLRSEIITDQIRPDYKQSFLTEIDRYLAALDPPNPNSDFDPSSLLLPFFAAYLFGYTLEVEKQRYAEKFVRIVADEVVKNQAGDAGDNIS